MANSNNLVKYPDIQDTVHPTLRDTQFEKLLKFCKQNNVLYQDKQFPPNQASLFKSATRKGYDGKMNDIVFNRPKNIFPKDKYYFIGDEVDPTDICQGQLGHCYFLSSIASLSEQTSLISRLFFVKDFNPNGVIGVWLFINGFWRLYPLDEYFPTRKNRNGVVALTFSSNYENEFWVAALEKAYAKAYGSYYDIVGGDPVFSLRDLTGAPFERIQEFTDIKKIWKKVLDAVVSNYILCACSRAVTGEVEGNLGMGVVGGHAYSILDARNVVDSKNKPRMIIQLRNPWGSHEWTGEFADNSNSWTAALKKELKVEKKDDGIFWMPFEQFTKFYDAIAILKIIPGYINNSLLVKRDTRSNSSLLRIVVNDPTAHVTFSIDQTDSRIYDDPDYYYCYFRLMVGKIISDEKIEFVHHQAVADRNIFFESNFAKGDYIILVTCFWNNDKLTEYVVGTYSDVQVDLEMLPADQNLMDSTERLLWIDFAKKNKTQFKNKQTKVHKLQNLSASVEYGLYEDPNSLTKVHAYYNNSRDVTVHQSQKFEIKNYDVISQAIGKGKAELMINPGEVQVLIFAARMFAGLQFQSMQYVTSVELLTKPFQNDKSVVHMLATLGSQHPTIKDEDPEIKSRDQKKKEFQDNKVINAISEKARANAKDDYAQKVNEKATEKKDFQKKQSDSFYGHIDSDPNAQKYINPDTKKIDPYYVITESFKDINIQKNDNDGNQKIQKIKYYDGPEINKNGFSKKKDGKKEDCIIF